MTHSASPWEGRDPGPSNPHSLSGRCLFFLKTLVIFSCFSLKMTPPLPCLPMSNDFFIKVEMAMCISLISFKYLSD